MKENTFIIVLSVLFLPTLVFGATLNLDYSTYLGGSSNDYGYGISLGTDGKAYVTGYTTSFDFPTENPYQAEYGGNYYIAFVTAFSSSGSAVFYSTYLGGGRF